MKERKPTYEVIIQKLLESQPDRWFMSYELIGKRVVIDGKEYWLGTSADRIARYMAEEGRIDRQGRDEHQFYARYRAKQGQLAMSF